MNISNLGAKLRNLTSIFMICDLSASFWVIKNYPNLRLTISDGKYRYNEVSISIYTSGTVIDKYRYFPFHENSKNISGNFEKILEGNGKILKYRYWKNQKKLWVNFQRILEVSTVGNITEIFWNVWMIS